MPAPPLPELPSALDARFPILLLPVSLQVKFVQPTPTSYELRVRIYPDQVSISTHEDGLTLEEKKAGQAYWQGASQVTAGQLHDLSHWRALVARFGAPRSRWILKQTYPINAEELLAYPAINPLYPTPLLAVNDERWTRAAEARGLPDRFQLLLYTQAATVAEVAAGPVREQLFTAPGRAYNVQTVPRPTTEFLQLAKVVEGAPLGGDALAVGFSPASSEVPSSTNAESISGIDAGNKWTVDFEEAIGKGMGIRVPLTKAEYLQGFQRLVVLGVRADDANTGQHAIHELLSEHYYTDGLQLVPQGTPTNNTEVVAAGYSSRERTEVEASFDLLSQVPNYTRETPWAERSDGQHLAMALGLSTPLPALPFAQGHDVGDAMAMNRALWPATYGYFLEEMLRPLLPPDALAWTRDFFETYVLARGAVPALRVGSQPYGVLPTTRFSEWEVQEAAGQPRTYAEQLQRVLRQFDATWTERLNPQPDLYPATVGAGATATGLPVPGSTAGNLLSALGLDATSTEYYQRYFIGPIVADALNSLAQTKSTTGDIWPAARKSTGTLDPADNPLYQNFKQLLDPSDALGLPATSLPIFRQTFQSTFTKLADAFADEPAARRQEGVLIDEQVLSETTPIAPFKGLKPAFQGSNYIQWLATASFDEVRLEDFSRIVDDANAFKAPNSLLYLLLRQAVLLQHWAAAKEYLAAAGEPLPAAALPEKEVYNILSTGEKARWAWLYDPAPGGTPEPLYQRIRVESPALRTYLHNLERLAPLSTAQLERLLAEHLDLGSYRLDAWRLAPVTQRLATLRQQAATAHGSHLGAYGWLEDVKPTDRPSVPNNLLKSYEDPDSLGYIHAPSLTHGTTAAILRQGYKSRQLTADASDPVARRMAVDLSSRRVRAAMALLEGLRAGHSLGTLLGQSFERALQQSNGLAAGRPYGSYVASFRFAFPLANEYALVEGQPAAQGLPSEQAARQVMDGAALLRAAGRGYPYGVRGLPAAAESEESEEFEEFIKEQVALLTDGLDALGDLAVSEGIFQAARGNVDRAAAVLESIAKGQFPLQPEVVHSPGSGLSLTQRVLVHLPTDTTLSAWPTPATPRARAAPRLNAWLAQFFPAPQQLTLRFGYQRSDGTWETEHSSPLFGTGLHPIDLLYLLDESALQEGSTFDRLLLRTFAPQAAADTPGAGARLRVRYSSADVPALRRLLPLLARLRQLLGRARPARPNELQLPGSSTAANEDTGVDIPGLTSRLYAGRQALQALVNQLGSATAANQVAGIYQAALFGLAEATSALAPDADLLSASTLVRQAAQARLDKAKAAAKTTDTVDTLAPGAPLLTVSVLLEVAAGLFGPAFLSDVEFGLTGEARATYIAATGPSASRLLRHYQAQPLALLEWLHGVGAVREPMNHLDKIFLIQSLLSPDGPVSLPLQPAQLSATTTAGDPYWLGLEWPAGYQPPAHTLSLVQWLPTNYDATTWQCALWVDEWTESLPEAQQTTALTFHYDQPNTEAPQSLLLVVSPRADNTTGWKTADLLGAVNETLDLAKKRTVEPDDLSATHLAAVLPAVVAPVAQQAVTFTLDLGRLNNTARFQEESLSV